MRSKHPEAGACRHRGHIGGEGCERLGVIRCHTVAVGRHERLLGRQEQVVNLRNRDVNAWSYRGSAAVRPADHAPLLLLLVVHIHAVRLGSSCPIAASEALPSHVC